MHYVERERWKLLNIFMSALIKVQGRGHGSRLFALVHKIADVYKANMYVLALEDSCVYWMSKGFVLEDGEINKRLNVFPDTHLLKYVTSVITGVAV